MSKNKREGDVKKLVREEASKAAREWLADKERGGFWTRSRICCAARRRRMETPLPNTPSDACTTTAMVFRRTTRRPQNGIA